MAPIIPDCWRGLRSPHWRWHAEQRPPWYKVELLDGVLVLTLRTRAVRDVIDRLSALPSARLPDDAVLVTSNRSDLPVPVDPAEDDRLRRHDVFHDAAATSLRADLEASLCEVGRDELQVLLGAAWQPTPDAGVVDGRHGRARGLARGPDRPSRTRSL